MEAEFLDKLYSLGGLVVLLIILNIWLIFVIRDIKETTRITQSFLNTIARDIRGMKERVSNLEKEVFKKNGE